MRLAGAFCRVRSRFHFPPATARQSAGPLQQAGRFDAALPPPPPAAAPNLAPLAPVTQVQATVDSVDLSQNPPLLSINGQTYPLNKVTKIARAGS